MLTGSYAVIVIKFLELEHIDSNVWVKSVDFEINFDHPCFL